MYHSTQKNKGLWCQCVHCFWKEKHHVLKHSIHAGSILQDASPGVFCFLYCTADSLMLLFPLFSYPKCSFPALDTFQHNGKNILSYAMYSNFLWNPFSCWRKRAYACQPARRPILQQSCAADRVLLGSETIHPGGKLVLSVGRWPPEWHQ